MFGDCGHGLLMFLFALYLVYNEKKLKNMKDGGEVCDRIFGRVFLEFKRVSDFMDFKR